jgi:hypothetical protein
MFFTSHVAKHFNVWSHFAALLPLGWLWKHPGLFYLEIILIASEVGFSWIYHGCDLIRTPYCNHYYPKLLAVDQAMAEAVALITIVYLMYFPSYAPLSGLDLEKDTIRRRHIWLMCLLVVHLFLHTLRITYYITIIMAGVVTLGSWIYCRWKENHWPPCHTVWVVATLVTGTIGLSFYFISWVVAPGVYLITHGFWHISIFVAMYCSFQSRCIQPRVQTTTVCLLDCWYSHSARQSIKL